MSSEIRAIINQESFRKRVYEVFASKTMKKYLYQDEANKTTQKMYDELDELLSNKTRRDLFFDNSITLMTLPKNIMTIALVKKLINRHFEEEKKELYLFTVKLII